MRQGRMDRVWSKELAEAEEVGGDRDEEEGEEEEEARRSLKDRVNSADGGGGGGDGGGDFERGTNGGETNGPIAESD